MSNEVLPFISNDVVEAFQDFDDDFLADALRVWDCYEQDWHDGFTTVFRFENDDLLVWNEMGGLRVKRGAVDTQSFHPELSMGSNEDSCMVWRSDSSFASLIGRAALSTTLLDSFM